MMGSKPIPKSDKELQPYNMAVAGHDGTMCDSQGELFIKPCTDQELRFYKTANESHQAFADLMPVFMGELALNDTTDVNDIDEQLPAVSSMIPTETKAKVIKQAKEQAAEAAAPHPASSDEKGWEEKAKSKKIKTNKSVVLENSAYGYTRPNIMDAKLGKRLWADDAPQAKKIKFDEVSAETTSGSHGFRIAGMRVYKGDTDPGKLDAMGYKVYDKNYGRNVVKGHNLLEAMRKFIFNPQAGIDEELGKIIAGLFLNDLRRIEEVLASEESRMYSASLLFTFEGDGNALRAALDQTRADMSAEQYKKEDGPYTPGLSASRVDSGIEMDDEGQMVFPINAAMSQNMILANLAQTPGSQDMEFSADSDGESSNGDIPRIYSLKLIDFAHAEWTPGQGPDENSLFGVRSLIKIFEQLADD
ncbi:inositol polyphosphate kinase-domain-containing protein [Pseudoneurospora amorphoporcata]|uniref:Kinase n=1 Tax=Pseudoneurospora amorphoporcata TaxID=241081 RepID=A0AAN6NTF2_9PEZI|nr:inositol polyphosphate kinase-domain-containing protein [Pseudoneurospora amorphoporcata]